ncbi:DNA polymerase III subunit beta [Gloeocapsopsis sp. IPPAS B-1203]|uniref:DNA polymerase III subunit beta n=1 Tax=Gloeocapsopsis sp. IPPAS B-1203 TaxID=2049454 RepID=UPI000C174483|nr:DNA polymerase III subunit beta [Gloeocapsopsis sp. IPPAS B-1203]PIG93047.1 DNA polymerase III subunit beta [Gloeocapsopsis sp. IPPAS B-1203]
MKFVCNQSDISTNLSLVSRAVPSRPTHPILANVLLTADAQTGQVSLTAFDLSLGIRTSFLAVVETGGEITLPAKLLNDIISRMPQGELAIDDEGETPLGATITSTSGKYQVRGMGVEEFPELPVIENGEAIHLPVEALTEGLRGSLFATSADETKQILSGLHLSIEQETLEFAATDGHRLAVVQTINENAPIEADTAQLEVTLPAKALRELERMLGMLNDGAVLSLHCDRGQVVFEWENHRLTSRTLEGQYPAYRQLIPRQFEIQVSLERKFLLSAIERIAVLADQKNNIVKFTLDSANQELALSVDAQDIGSGRESMPAQISGDSIDIAFNIKYLVDGLKALPSSDIQMQINTPTSPVILTPLGGVKMTYLIMPVQIRT